jgi:hypothetical protein
MNYLLTFIEMNVETYTLEYSLKHQSHEWFSLRSFTRLTREKYPEIKALEIIFSQ